MSNSLARRGSSSYAQQELLLSLRTMFTSTAILRSKITEEIFGHIYSVDSDVVMVSINYAYRSTCVNEQSVGLFYVQNLHKSVSEIKQVFNIDVDLFKINIFNIQEGAEIPNISMELIIDMLKMSKYFELATAVFNDRLLIQQISLEYVNTNVILKHMRSILDVLMYAMSHTGKCTSFQTIRPLLLTYGVDSMCNSKLIKKYLTLQGSDPLEHSNQTGIDIEYIKSVQRDEKLLNQVSVSMVSYTGELCRSFDIDDMSFFNILYGLYFLHSVLGVAHGSLDRNQFTNLLDPENLITISVYVINGVAYETKYIAKKIYISSFQNYFYSLKFMLKHGDKLDPLHIQTQYANQVNDEKLFKQQADIGDADNQFKTMCLYDVNQLVDTFKFESKFIIQKSLAEYDFSKNPVEYIIDTHFQKYLSGISIDDLQSEKITNVEFSM
jgi:hypothetical protein